MKTKVISIFSSILFAMLLSCNQTNLVNNKENQAMKVKVVSLEKCGATQPTIELVKKVAQDMGLEINFTHTVVNTQDEAKKHRHIGSPTVQINGLDIDPTARNIEQFGIT
jgi:hypothetical protein